jgi:hypothetical protein
MGAESPDELRHIDPAKAHALARVLSEEWPTISRDGEVRAELRYALVDDRRTRVTLLMSELFDKNVWAAPRRAARLVRRRLK